MTIIKVVLGIIYLFLGCVCLSVYESWNIDGADDMTFVVILAWPAFATLLLFVVLLALGHSVGKIIVKWLDKLMEE